ncbi:MAG: RIFT barrel domain-containing protein [Thermogutta sp.]
MMIPSWQYSTSVCITFSDVLPWGPNVGIPLRFGVPLPRGRVVSPCQGRLVSPDGNAFPIQLTPLTRWPDGSLRWIRVDTVARMDTEARLPGMWRVDLWASNEEINQAASDVVPLHAGRIIRPYSDKNTVFTLEKPSWGEKPCLSARLFVRTKTGSLGVGKRHLFRWLAHGPIRYEVLAEGSFRGISGLIWRLTLGIYPSLNAVHLKATVRNTHRARHRGGLWDLGDSGSILLREFGLELNFANPLKRFFWRLNTSDDFHVLDKNTQDNLVSSTASNWGKPLLWQIFQASSGGNNWQSFNHVNSRGQITLPFRGYRVITEGNELSGDRADPSCCIQTTDFCSGFWLPFFWQEFPKRIDVTPTSATLAFLADSSGDAHELQGGEQKTYVAWIVFGDESDGSRDGVLAQLAALCREATTQPNITASIPELPACLPLSGCWRESHLAQFAEEAAFGPKGLLAGREEIDEYGWRHFGDVFASHEKTFYQGTLPFISHYNNQFDLLCGLILQRLLSNDPRWESLIHPLARHVIDIDIYHTTCDRSTFNGAMFWMTDHYLSAATATHRAFSRKNAKRPGYGGGPSNEQNYTSGLSLYYLIWGEEDARDAVLALANWVISMEDGRQTPFFLADDGPTGLATATGSPDYHGPGRGSANSVNALLDAWLISGNGAYRTWAEALCRRVIHPKDDPAAFDLLHAELRWSYTMFLETVCKFLRIKCLFGEHDHMFEYLRRCLIRYCDWMVLHERPYLDYPEELEYPTEAWVAQEFRKATVLFLAADFCESARANQYRAKAAWFADKAWEELNRFETRINPRTAAVILNQATWHLPRDTSGSRQCCLQRMNQPLNVESRQSFVPQKARVRAMLTSPACWPRIAIRLLNPYNWFRLAWILWKWRN